MTTAANSGAEVNEEGQTLTFIAGMRFARIAVIFFL